MSLNDKDFKRTEYSEELSNKLEDTFKNENMETFYQAIDNLKDLSELGESIPGVGNVVKLINMGNSYADYRLGKKVLRFLCNLHETSESERREFLNKMNKNLDKTEKVGEKVLNLLDSIDDSRKERLIGALFKKAIKEELYLDELYRLVAAVNRAYYSDLEYAISAEADSAICEGSTYENLFHAGLARVSGLDSGGFSELNTPPDAGLDFELNLIGERLVFLLKDELY